MKTLTKPLAGSIAVALLMLAQTASAATLRVTGTVEPASGGLASASCVTANGATTCATLRDAINVAATNADASNTIVFATALDGATISLTMYTNCLSASATTVTSTCLPQPQEWAQAAVDGQNQVTQFGASAFYVPKGIPQVKTLTIDATANGLTQGVTLARASAAPPFRLFNVGVGATLNLKGLRLHNGKVQGGSGRGAGGALGAGGAIFSQGTVRLERCTLDTNSVVGGNSGGPQAAWNFGGGGVGSDSLPGSHGGAPNGGMAGIAGSAANGGQGGNGTPGGFGGGGGAGGDSLDGYGDRIGGAAGKGGFGGGGGTGGTWGDFGDAGAGAAGGFGGGGGSTPGYFGNDSPGGFAGGIGDSGTYGGGGGGLGGAIFNDAGKLHLINVTLAQNSAIGGNGAWGGQPGSGYGGAIFNYNGELSVEFSTFSGNVVKPGGCISGVPCSAQGTRDAGAIYSLGDSLEGCSAGGNACTRSGAVMNVNRTILVGSTDGSQVLNDIVVNALSGSASTTGGSANVIAGVSGGTLAPASATVLQNLGALTLANVAGFKAVIVPVVTSSAVDAAPCLAGVTVDQRGVGRPQGASCDIGAVERENNRIFCNGFQSGACAALRGDPGEFLFDSPQ